ncbi:MAG: hypothetical protein ABGZ53_36695 [Fuerstiella sp.]
MEKLQPVIKQIFWILFGLALLLVVIGWWTANGALSTQIEARNGEVNKAFADAEQNVSAVPNKDWTDAAQTKNDEHKKEFTQSANGLRKDQLGARTYPVGIRDELNQLKYGSKIEKKTLREQFARLYLKYFHEQLMVIKPFINGEGLVDVSNAQITQENPSRWRTVRPTSPEIWHAQEDIWLLRSILDSIAAVNVGAERIDKAPIRSLLVLRLRGGDRDAPAGGSAGGGFAGGGFGGDSDYEGGMMSAMDSGFGGSSGVSGGGGASEVWKSFQGSLGGDLLTEEFGAGAGDSGGGGEMGISSSSDYDEGGDDYDEGGDDYDDGGSSGGFGSAAGSTKRYVDDGVLYRSRAFQLEVKILQQEIPSLLAELTNSSFPVEIVRVDASFGAGSSGVLSSGMGGGGYEGGDYEGDDYEGDSGGMSGGFGGNSSGASGLAGMGGLGGRGGRGMGGGGLGSSGLGGADFGGGITGLGSGLNGSGNTPGSRALAKKKAIGARLLAAAMADPNIATVRVAGLMTMYISQEENEAQEGAEAAAETESQEEGGVDLPPDETLTDAVEQEAGTDTSETAEPDENSENGSDATEASATPLDEPNSTDTSADGPSAPNDTSQPPAAVEPPTGL